MNIRLVPIMLTVVLAACDIPGLGPDPRIAQREADGKAIGAACRHAIRGIEECYNQNEKALKTAVFEGWKEMDQYMRENKIEGIPPREVRVAAQDEVIIEDKKGKPVAKSEVDNKARADVAMKTPRSGDKPGAKAPAP